jgi:uncharacterized protein (TIGR03790 family)
VTARWCRALVGVYVLSSVVTHPAAAQTGENVLIVANSASTASVEIAEYYAAKRGVPKTQILRLELPLTEDIARNAYLGGIERPIAEWLTTQGAQDRILYLVLTKDVPLRISGTPGPEGSIASVDSELTLLYRKLAGVQVLTAGSSPNPYFLDDGPVADAKPFTHERQDLFLVARLDGYTVADVKGLIDRASTPAKEGSILLDQRTEWQRTPGNVWLEGAAAKVKSLPGWAERVNLEIGGRVLRDEQNVLGYYSWGSNDPAITVRRLRIQFLSGAIGGMFVSSDGRTFKEPPDTWQVRDATYAGTNQSLIGDLIREGITGISGHVAEPYLNGTIRPDILFPAYLSGFNLIESFYLAMPFVSWQTIVIGDPLCAPFQKAALAAEAIDRGLDAVTELPTFLSARRVATLVKEGIKPEAAALYAKSEVRLTKKDRAGARQALEQATAIDEGLIRGHIVLAELYSADSQVDASIDRYRRVIERDPKHAAALNNLAYALAVQRNKPDEALPLARRAFAAGNRSPMIADTLGWVYHLLGNDVEAEPLLVAAVNGAPQNAEVHWHASVVLTANGKTALAARTLDRALELDKTLEQREEVKKLKERLLPVKR